MSDDMITFEGIDFIGTPDCEVVSQKDEAACSEPCVIRMLTECLDCGRIAVRFFCRGHFKGSLQGQVACGDCWSGRVNYKRS